MAAEVDAPPPRNLENEYSETLNAQLGNLPDLIGGVRRFGPQLTEANLSSQRPIIGFYENEIYPSLNRTEAATAESRVGSAIDIANQYGQGLRDTNRRFNPENTALLDELNRQAQSELEANGALSGGELRDLQQATRAGQTARGLGTGRADYFAEVLNTDALQRQRRNEARQFAGNMVGLNASNNPNALLYASSQNPDLVGRSIGLGGIGLGSRAGNVGQYLDFQSPYAADLYNTNYNAAYSTAVANANNQNAIRGAAIDAVGNIIGGWTGGLGGG